MALWGIPKKKWGHRLLESCLLYTSALGNSEDSSALSAADKEKMFAPYEQYGMTYDAVKDELTYNGNLVRWFEDYYPIGNNETAGIDFLNENGTVDAVSYTHLRPGSQLWRVCGDFKAA